ncbi:iron complex outermembrane recepter protein [Nitrosospira multiformis ATCC 25196]|uniref:Iron complex outermembrane recepter protein n=1 Tax=Nitrosospira multiformis (strain ATCC 25196 / NCIMB 11849 / C 71) TaxID=323848 RepID=Q2YBC9_NITMU|nr:TonB-dependent receptor [Nitrosospira multiformis]ABB73942.1 TonB-dependent receptor [Nitrosospira multiformis ATCC 25196]SEF52963.1 iron complex outermembrane recepter protein [Nitrosospira multiformis ATCC 25196]
MKRIPFALVGLLCVPSAWAMQEIEQPKQFSQKRIPVRLPATSLSMNPAQSDTPVSSMGSETRSGMLVAEATAVTTSGQPQTGETGTGKPDKDREDKENKGGKEKKDDIPAVQKETVFKEMVVTGETERDTHFTSPSTRVTRAQIERQNAQTTEEVLKYMPSLQIRQRYVGDPNGVLGIRGADMFSTARNMVYADGLPLHNFLQATFNGAPRWSLVGPNEIDSVDVVYGPFSAEYSGNSIGGVVNIKTRMPHKQEFYVESSLFIQPFKIYGPDKGTFIGDRQYVSYGNRIQDKFTVFLAYNRLEAQSHPQSYFIDNTGLFDVPGGTPVSGGIRTPDTRGTPSVIYGDTGPEKVNTHLFKGKFGYDITSNLQALFTVAYEDRTRHQNRPRNYLRDGSGNLFWGGPAPTCAPGAPCANPENALGNASLDGTRFDVMQRGFGGSQDKRETLNLGLSLRGALTPDWNIDTTMSYFDVLKDIRASAFFNQGDPANSGTGQLQDFRRFSWLNYDLKLSAPVLLGNDKVSFLAGYHFDQYNLSFRQYSLTDYSTLTRGALQANRNNDGQTSMHAMFAQSTFRFLPQWDVTAGVRQEWWAATKGVVGNLEVPDRSLAATSPKVSVGYEPGQWKYRYSFGRAHRFPVIAELYQSLSTPTSILTANAMLKPENGVHHNFMVEYGLPKGYIRVNAFRDDIKDAIQQVNTVSGVVITSGFQNIGQVSTTGVELIYDQRRILGSKLDFMFNGTWMNAKVEKGPIVDFTTSTGVPADYNLTGKQIIRLPHWRANFFGTYHMTEAWDISLSGRYTSDSFNDPDNGDHVNNVFGSQSDFFFMDFKTSYRYKFQNGLKSRFSFGISNLNNDKAWVFHPYPQRTYLVEAAFSY